MAIRDNQTAVLAKQIKDKVVIEYQIRFLMVLTIILQLARQKLLETAKILCDVLEEPLKKENILPNNLVNLPRLQYISEQSQTGNRPQSSGWMKLSVSGFNYSLSLDNHLDNSGVKNTHNRLYLPGIHQC